MGGGPLEDGKRKKKRVNIWSTEKMFAQKRLTFSPLG